MTLVKRALPRFLMSLVALGLFVTSLESLASTAARPDSYGNDELREITVSEADAIVEAVLDSAVERMVQVSSEPSFRRVRFVVLRPVRALKGSILPGPVRAYLFETNPAFEELQRRAGTKSRAAGIFFLDHGTIEVSVEHGAVKSEGWGLNAWPDLYKGGLLWRDEAGWDDDVSALPSIIAKQSPDSLAVRADIVLVGSAAREGVRCPIADEVPLCAQIVVDSVIVGNATADTIYIKTGRRGFVQTGQGLFYLESMGDDTYSIVGFKAGALGIRAGSVGFGVGTLPDVARRVRRARRSQE